MATLQIPPPSSNETSFSPLTAPLTDVAERSLNFTKAAAAVVFLLRGEELIVGAKAGAVMENLASIPVAGSFVGRAMQTGRVVRCDNVDSDPTVNVSPFLPLQVRSFVAIPLGTDSRKIPGVLVVLSDRVAGFLRTHLAILQTLADVAAEKCRNHNALAPPAESKTSFPVQHPSPAPLQPTLVTPSQAPLQTATAGPSLPAAEIRAAWATDSRGTHEEVLALAEAPKPLAPPHTPAMVPRNPAVAYAPAASRPRVMTAYDRPPVVRRSSRPKFIPVTFAVLVLAFLGVTGGFWIRSHRSAATVAVSSGPAAPALSSAVPEAAAPAVQPPMAQPVAPSAPASVAAAKHDAGPPFKPGHSVIKEAAKEVSEEETPPAEVTPPLRLPSAVAHKESLKVEAPSLVLGSNQAPELIAARSAIPVAPVSKPVPARLVQQVAPEYPLLLRRVGREGSVSLRLHISRQGGVDGVEMTGGDRAFLSAAEAAVKQWRYAPATLDGKPVATVAEVVVQFKLPRK